LATEAEVADANATRMTRGGPVEHCLACGSTKIAVAVDFASTNFLCETCQSCWHVEFAHVWRVDPHTCMTCVHRADCLGVHQPISHQAA
jgi:hypothetical protein